MALGSGLTTCDLTLHSLKMSEMGASTLGFQVSLDIRLQLLALWTTLCLSYADYYKLL